MLDGVCVNRELALKQIAMSKKPRKQYTFKNKPQKQPLDQLVTEFKSQPGLLQPNSPHSSQLVTEGLLEQMFSPRPARAKLAVPSTIVEEDEHALESIKVPKVGEPAAAVKRSASNTDSVTPRTAFAKTYFSKPVTLLNKFPEDLESKAQHKLLFQVSFTSPDQFTNYANLSKSSRKIDCFYQSLFSIGLREVNKAKLDSVEINEKGKLGVWPSAQKEYLMQMFGLRESQIHSEYSGEIKDAKGFHNTKVTLDQIKDVFKRKLKDNHATLLHLCAFQMRMVTLPLH